MKNVLLIASLWLFVFACTPSKKEENHAETTQKMPAIDPVFAKGEALFKQHCAACHNLDSKLIGPALGGISQKYAGDEKWLYAFIRNSQKMIQAGDPKAVALFEASGKALMNSFPFLTDEDIAALIVYMDKGMPIVD